MIEVAQETFLENSMPDIKEQWYYYLSLLDVKNNHSIIDIGCYTGDTEFFILKEQPSIEKIVGIDYGKDRYDTAVLKWKNAGSSEQIEFKLAHAEKLPYPDDSFERALCVDMLEWSKKPINVIDEIYRVLKPGGIALIIHTDFDTQAFSVKNKKLCRKIIQVFSDAGPNGQMGRELYSLCKNSKFINIEPSIYPLFNTTWDENFYSYRIAHMMIDWLLREKIVEEDETKNWLKDIEGQVLNKSFFYSVNRYICCCKK